MKYLIIVPIYNHTELFKPVFETLKTLPYEILIINDGSSQEETEALEAIIGNECLYINHVKNQGKGGAVITGIKTAKEKGYSHVIQVDADGQHNLELVEKLVALSKENQSALVTAIPIYDETVPAHRKWGHWFTNLWVRIETLSVEIKDVMCGFRVYPVDGISGIVSKRSIAKRMGFDVEVMVRAYWKGIPILNIPVSVQYQKNGRSHFRPFEDNLEISLVHTRLVAEAPFRMMWRGLRSF